MLGCVRGQHVAVPCLRAALCCSAAGTVPDAVQQGCSSLCLAFINPAVQFLMDLAKETQREWMSRQPVKKKEDTAKRRGIALEVGPAVT